MLSTPDIWAEFFGRYYRDKVNELAGKSFDDVVAPVLYVNVKKDLVYFHEMRLMTELFEYPDIVIKHAEEGLTLTPNIFNVELRGKVRFVNLPATRKVEIRGLRSKHAGKFVSIEGMVRKATKIFSLATVATFRCKKCGKTEKVVVEGYGRITPPGRCKACKGTGFQMIGSERVDFQRLEIQEYPENLRGGETPQTIQVFLKEDLVGMVFPGSRIVVNGIARLNEQGGKAIEEMYIEANSVEILEKDYEEITITQEDERKIKELAKDSQILQKIVASVAPSIYGHEDVKLAIALQLFGGTPKTLPDGTFLRGDIHILLVGDPGSAKSQMLRYVHNIAPRSIYSTGKGASAAGLTAAVSKDDFDGRWTLEAGVLVLADKGTAIVDELDKMSKEDRNALHTALEQQIVSINKAGINAVLKSRCSLLAAANPKYGRFDRYTPLPEQIDLDPALLSRFDLIFVIVDEQDERKDRELARHILSAHKGELRTFEPAIDLDLLKKYIAYARRNVRPRLSNEAAKVIEDYYVSVRRRARENSPVPLTARQLEAIVRLAEASAKLRLSDVVTAEDAKRVIELVERCLKEVAVDPETGEMDIDILTTGTPKRDRDRILILKRIIERLESASDAGAPEEEVLRAAEGEGIEAHRAKEILSKMKERGDVYCPRIGYYRIITN